MKKIITIAAIAALALLSSACKKDNGTGGTPVCDKIELVFNVDAISQDILNNFTVTFSGKDFDGKDFSNSIKGPGKTAFTVNKANLTDKDAYPFTYALEFKAKDNIEQKSDYDGTLKYSISFHGYDPNGNEFKDGDGHMCSQDSNVHYSTVEKFKAFIENDSIATSTYKFWFCQTLSGSWHVGWTKQ